MINLKTNPGPDQAEIAAKADKLSYICGQIESLSAQKSELEAYFLKLADSDLADVKRKTKVYHGSGHVRIRAQMARSLKVMYPALLKKAFGDAFGDMVTVDVKPKYKVSAPAERLLTGIWTGEYLNGASVDEVLRSVTCDGNILTLLHKKVKGNNYDKDVKNLINIAGMTDDEAEETAFMVSEAAVWEAFTRLTDAAGAEDRQRVIGDISAAVAVEESPKIYVEVE